jgi:hypothetical protein
MLADVLADYRTEYLNVLKRHGYYTYHQVQLKKGIVFENSAFVYFVHISNKQRLSPIQYWLVFVTETLYCAVRTESLNITRVIFRLWRVNNVQVPRDNALSNVFGVAVYFVFYVNLQTYKKAYVRHCTLELTM